jgi:hypothetical protein
VKRRRAIANASAQLAVDRRLEHARHQQALARHREDRGERIRQPRGVEPERLGGAVPVGQAPRHRDVRLLVDDRVVEEDVASPAQDEGQSQDERDRQDGAKRPNLRPDRATHETQYRMQSILRM